MHGSLFLIFILNHTFVAKNPKTENMNTLLNRKRDHVRWVLVVWSISFVTHTLATHSIAIGSFIQPLWYANPCMHCVHTLDRSTRLGIPKFWMCVLFVFEFLTRQLNAIYMWASELQVNFQYLFQQIQIVCIVQLASQAYINFITQLIYISAPLFIRTEWKLLFGYDFRTR